MKTGFLSLAAGAALAMGATAAIADGYEAPSRGYVKPFDWSGFYVGAYVGYQHNNFDWAFNPPVGGAVNQSFSLTNDYGILGFHSGYQHQFGAVVLGVE